MDIFLLHNYIYKFFQLILSQITYSNIISTIALIISLYTLMRELKNKLTITWPNNLEILSSSDIGIGKNFDVFDTPIFIKIRLEVVNYSKTDIGFFDLRAFNPRSNITYMLITSKALPLEAKALPLNLITQKIYNTYMVLDIPESTYGVFKANSLTRFDILCYAHPKHDFENQIVISFKTADKKWSLQDPFVLNNRGKFKTYRAVYNIESTQKIKEL